MKNLNKRNIRQRGFTAPEMVIAVTVMAILGIVFMQVLNSGMILYAKNTAVNAAHQEAREGINRLTRDIHAAISVPQLRSSTHDSTYTTTGSFTVVSSAPANGVAPTAAGVSFQDALPGSPDYIWQDPNSATLILIKDPGDTPRAGMRLIVPFWGIEDDIVKTQQQSTPASHSNIFLATGAEATIASKARKFGQSTYTGFVSPYAICYYTERMLYVVENGTYIADSQGPWILSNGQYIAYTSGAMQRYRYENGVLNLYNQYYSSPNGQNGYLYWNYKATVARYISSPQPFYIPLNAYGTPDTRYVGVNLTARDPSTSNRGYLATASLLNTQIDYRSRICLYQ
jgi:prepilin-type N-terminal cleavage/methylation domain-containing protein